MVKEACSVKLITAVVKLDKLDDVMRAISGAGARGLTVTEVHGFGQQYGHLVPDKSADQNAFVLPKLRVDVLVQDEAAEPVADAIAKSVNTGAIGDGKIWVCPVDSVLRVRTGERDRDAV
jgi:nitrogen regulatory protein PII